MLNGIIQTVERDALRHDPVQSAELERSSHGKLVAIHGQPVAGGWMRCGMLQWNEMRWGALQLVGESRVPSTCDLKR